MQETIEQFYRWVDSGLVLMYRLSGIPLLDYFLGTLGVCLLAVILGELTVSAALRVNRRHTDDLNAEIRHLESLSIAAYEAGDRDGYRALNRKATDSWGRQFFTMAAYSAGILWPIPFTLQWMQWRFGDVQFPIAFPFRLLFPDGVGYLFTFFPLYILARVVFKHLRPYLPYFRGVQKMLDAYDRPSPPPAGEDGPAAGAARRISPSEN